MKTCFVFLLVFVWTQCSSFAGNRCSAPTNFPTGLDVRPGFVEFIPKEKLAPFKAALPQIQNEEITTAMNSADAMWYDEEHMVYSYQDSIETVVGNRANCVAREVGETNGYPISKLKNFFGTDYKFMFPFRTVAGSDNVTNIKTINFWLPPKELGQTLPVKYWRPTQRGRWRWVFPVGTLFGEVLFEKAPDGKWYAFEVRTRKRYKSGWAVNLFRPFPTALSLVAGIEKFRSNWSSSSELAGLIEYLKNKNTLVPNRMESKAFGSVFPKIEGALDPLPGISDSALIVELLTKTPFVSTEGAIWKENGKLETYAPGSQAEFHIVPKNYEMGMIAVNEVSCARCHSETGRKIGHFDFDVQLYGEIWGEDHIFTWHLFQPKSQIYGTFDDSDGSRTLNPRLVKAGLVKNEKPTVSEPFYQALVSAFDDPKDQNIRGH